MELTGIVKRVGTEETFGTFTKRELVILTNEQYPQPISVEFVQDKVDLIDNVKEGETVKVHINIRGKEWTSPKNEVKYFNTIQGWRIEKTADEESGQPAQPSGKVPTATPAQAFLDESEDLSLPF